VVRYLAFEVIAEVLGNAGIGLEGVALIEVEVGSGNRDSVLVGRESHEEVSTGLVLDVSGLELSGDVHRPAVGSKKVLLAQNDVVDRFALALHVGIDDKLVDVRDPVGV
jgi:hypothetical protein